MPTFFSADTLTIGTAGADPNRINDALEGRGHGRPLVGPVRAAGGRLVVGVTGGNPAAVRDAILAAGAAGDVRLDPIVYNGTYQQLGARVPLAFEPEELSAPVPPPAPAWEPLPAGMRRPVIALLDCGVRDHTWFPKTAPEDPFLVDAEDPASVLPWVPPLPAPDPLAGHATFLAGIIRSAAPSARILSVRVLTGDGAGRESTVIGALEWLLAYRAAGHPVDVVCLPFGRIPDPADDPALLAGLSDVVGALADAGLQVTAPAGNDHTDTPVYPAAFRGVVAVGAGIGAYHARFSNYGGWVDRYREGVDIHGVLPPDRWARWSGTSFSVAQFVADLARPQVL